LLNLLKYISKSLKFIFKVYIAISLVINLKCKRLFSESSNLSLKINLITNTHTYQSFELLKSSA
jgi:hypothetical protein